MTDQEHHDELGKTLSEQPPSGRPPRRPDRFESTQRTAAIVLLSMVVPVIGYLLYAQWIGPVLQSRQSNSSNIQDALVASQLQATARAEVWAIVTAEAQAEADAEALADFRLTTEVEVRATVVAEAAATDSAEFIQQATLSAVETQSAFDILAMEGTVSAQVQSTSEAVAAATLEAYQDQQQDLLNTFVLATVQSLYEGDVTRVADTANNRTITIVSSVAAFVVGGVAMMLGASYLARPSRSRRTRQAEKQITASPQYVTVDCSCQAQQVLCHQCEGTGEVLYTDADTNRYMYRYCPRCNGTGYTDCEICSGRGQYYKEAKAIEMPTEEPAQAAQASSVGWSNRIRAFFALIDHIASNQRADP